MPNELNDSDDEAWPKLIASPPSAISAFAAAGARAGRFLLRDPRATSLVAVDAADSSTMARRTAVWSVGTPRRRFTDTADGVSDASGSDEDSSSMTAGGGGDEARGRGSSGRHQHRLSAQQLPLASAATAMPGMAIEGRIHLLASAASPSVRPSGRGSEAGRYGRGGRGDGEGHSARGAEDRRGGHEPPNGGQAHQGDGGPPASGGGGGGGPSGEIGIHGFWPRPLPFVECRFCLLPCTDCGCACLPQDRRQLPLPTQVADHSMLLIIHQHFSVPLLPWILVRAVRIGGLLTYEYTPAIEAGSDDLEMLNILRDSYRSDHHGRIQTFEACYDFMPRHIIYP